MPQRAVPCVERANVPLRLRQATLEILGGGAVLSGLLRNVVTRESKRKKVEKKK